MLKSYDKQEEIPEPLREHYSRREDGKYHADIPDTHPAVRHSATLLGEKQGAEERARTAEAALESAKASGLLRGHRAVTSADAELLERVKPLGSFEEIKAKLDEHAELKTAGESRAKQDALRGIAADNGYDPEKVAALEDRFPAPEFKDVEVNGKKERRAYFKVRDGEKDVERTFAEHLEADPKLKPLAEGLKAGVARGGTGHGRDPNPTGGSTTLEQIRKREQERQQKNQPQGGPVADRWHNRTAPAK